MKIREMKEISDDFANDGSFLSQERNGFKISEFSAPYGLGPTYLDGMAFYFKKEIFICELMLQEHKKTLYFSKKNFKHFVDLLAKLNEECAE